MTLKQWFCRRYEEYANDDGVIACIPAQRAYRFFLKNRGYYCFGTERLTIRHSDLSYHELLSLKRVPKGFKRTVRPHGKS